MADIDWRIVRGHGSKDIGAIGFIGNEAVVVAAFYDDRDGDKDGKVSLGEKFAAMVFPIRIDGMNIAQVARQAASDPDLVVRDPNLRTMANNLFMNFAKRAVTDGIYAVYFRPAVSGASGGVASALVRGKVKQFVVKKSAETAVKKAFQKATD